VSHRAPGAGWPQEVTAIDDAVDRLDATGLADAIRSGELSAREAVAHALHRIAERDAIVGATTEIRGDAALAEVDAGLPDGPLTGVPFVVKDLRMWVGGMRNANGSRLFADRVAPGDSELVARYRRAGLVVVATTKTPELGLNASTEPVHGGPARNPHGLSHSAGGSSGGTAAAVAAGMVPAGHASDGGGSIRIPAAACGLVGLKPTRGRTPTLPRRGAFAYPLSVNHAITRTVRDSALLLDVGAGPVPGDPFLAPLPARPYVDAAREAPPRCRVALCTVRPDGAVADPQCAKAAADAAALLASLGHQVTEAAPVFPLDAMRTASRVCMSVPLAAEVDAYLAELGRPLEDDDLEPFTRMMYETGKQLSGVEFVAALQQVERAGHELGPFFEQHDLLLTPTIAAPVPPLGHLDTTDVDAMRTYASTYSSFTSFANVSGQPAISLPFATDDEGMPIGVQLVAGFGREDLLLQVAGELEATHPRDTAPVWPPRDA
jgi:amidase